MERFKYIIFNRDLKPLYVDDNNFVLEGNNLLLKPNGQPVNLEFSPTGWDDILVKYFRNIKYWGVNRDMTVPMDFPRDGFIILKSLIWQINGGYETIAYLGIMKLDELSVPETYKPWYFSQLNFSKFNQYERSIKIEALEGGISKILKAFETTKYVIDIDEDPQHVNVLLDGITLHGKQQMLFGTQLFDPEINPADYFIFNFLMVKLTEEGSAPGISFLDSTYTGWVDTDAGSSVNYFLVEDGTNTAGTNVRIHGNVNLKLKTKRDNVGFFISLIKSNLITPFPVTKYWIYNIPISGSTPFTFEGEVRSIPFDFTIPINPGDKVYLSGQVGYGTGFGQNSAWEILEDSILNIDYTGKGLPSYTKGLYAGRVLEKIVEKMVGDNLIVSSDNIFSKSDWLDSKKDLVLTSGDAIRGLENSKLETSISDLFQSLNHYSVGLETRNQKIRIEPRDFFFDNEIVVQLGEIKGCYLTPANDLLFNKIKVGGPNIEYNDVNGKYEFNQLQNWVAPVTSETAEYDLSTPYRRDPYGIEFLRLLKGKDTTDDKGDKDVFMLNVEVTPNVNDLGLTYYKLNRPSYSTIEGVPDTNGIFNVELSPKRTLLNNINDIVSRLDRLDGRYITMNQSDKNNSLRTILSGVEVDEDKQIQIGSLGVKKFQPYYFNFITKVPVILPPIIDSKPYGKIEFLINGRPWYGRWMDGGIKPGDNDQQSWKLLVSEENDLSKFYEPI